MILTPGCATIKSTCNNSEVNGHFWYSWTTTLITLPSRFTSNANVSLFLKNLINSFL